MLFYVYVVFLLLSAVAMLAMAFVNTGGAIPRRVLSGILGAGLGIYGLYLLLFFTSGTYFLFYYVFILPIVLGIQFFRELGAKRRLAASGYQPAAGWVPPPAGYGQVPAGAWQPPAAPGYGQAPGGYGQAPAGYGQAPAGYGQPATPGQPAYGQPAYGQPPAGQAPYGQPPAYGAGAGGNAQPPAGPGYGQAPGGYGQPPSGPSQQQPYQPNREYPGA